MTGYRYLLAAYFLPRGMTRHAFDALGFDALAKPTKELRPDPKVVRDAVAALKKLGFAVARVDGSRVTLQANDWLLEEHFGVAYAVADPAGGRDEDQFVKSDGSGNPMASAEPLKEPLRSLLHIIAPLPTSVQNMPDPTSPATRAASKIEPWHVWPEEIRTALGGTRKDSSGAEEFLNWQGRGAAVALVDSGINTQHDQITKILRIATTGQPTDQLKLGTQVVVELGRIKTQFATELTVIQRELDLAKTLSDRLAAYVVRTDTGGLSLGAVNVRRFKTGPGGLDLSSFLPSAGPPGDHFQEFYQWQDREVTTGREGVGSPVMTAFLRAVTQHSGGTQPLAIDANLKTLIDKLRGWLQGERQAIEKTVNWAVASTGSVLRDYDGHGTGMAVSMLSVAPKARVRCHITMAPTERYWRLRSFVERNCSDFYYRALDIAIADTEGDLTHERKIVSNSWGTPRRTSASTTQETSDLVQLVAWIRAKVQTAVNKNFVICFSAGNSGLTYVGKINLTALASRAGAIIVGGAFKRPGPGAPIGDGTVMLSEAAHAFNFKRKDRTIFQDDGHVPDICALVGPVYRGGPPWNGATPYVYYPTIDQQWEYGGGGTSSACAQVAGICALIRARYPAISAGQIKELVTEHGPAVEYGSSFNKKEQGKNVLDTRENAVGSADFSAGDFTPRLKLVDIGEVLKVTRAKMKNVPPADGAPP